MTHFVIIILLVIFTIYAIFVAYEYHKHKIWFNTIEPGDKVLVNIHSTNCDCWVTATVSKRAEKNIITAVTTTQERSNCLKCAKTRLDNFNDCWYTIIKFKPIDVKKYNNEKEK